MSEILECHITWHVTKQERVSFTILHGYPMKALFEHILHQEPGQPLRFPISTLANSDSFKVKKLEKRPLLLNLNIFDIFFWNFYYCFWTGKCFLGHNHIVLSTILQSWRSALIMFQARNHKYRHKWDLTDNLSDKNLMLWPPPCIYLFKVNNCNNKTLCAICSNQWRRFDIFTVNFK